MLAFLLALLVELEFQGLQASRWNLWRFFFNSGFPPTRPSFLRFGMGPVVLVLNG